MAVAAGKFILVKTIIESAQAQGCELRTSKFQLVTPWGTRNLRFLFNPSNRGRFDVTDYSDDESMAPSSIDALERRLGIVIPRQIH